MKTKFVLGVVVGLGALVGGVGVGGSGGSVVLAAPATQAVGVASDGVIRIKAGTYTAVTDKAGHVWAPAKGFVDGDVIDRSPTLHVEGTDSPELFRTEHYDMSKFSQAVANGKYVVKLYFAETFDGVTAVGERVFTVDVEGKVLKDLDVFKEAGGANKAIVKTFEVEVTDGKLDIGFVAKEQATMVNAIEIIPAK